MHVDFDLMRNLYIYKACIHIIYLFYSSHNTIQDLLKYLSKIKSIKVRYRLLSELLKN